MFLREGVVIINSDERLKFFKDLSRQAHEQVQKEYRKKLIKQIVKSIVIGTASTVIGGLILKYIFS